MIRATGEKILMKLVNLPNPEKAILQVTSSPLYQIGRVVSVGDLVKGIEVGEYIWSRNYGNAVLQYEGEEYVCLMQHEVLGVSSELA